MLGINTQLNSQYYNNYRDRKNVILIGQNSSTLVLHECMYKNADASNTGVVILMLCLSTNDSQFVNMVGFVISLLTMKEIIQQPSHGKYYLFFSSWKIEDDEWMRDTCDGSTSTSTTIFQQQCRSKC